MKHPGAMLSFELKGAHPHDIATIIDRSGVAVRAGTHCAMPLLDRFGATSTCRASLALYNTTSPVNINSPNASISTVSASSRNCTPNDTPESLRADIEKALG